MKLIGIRLSPYVARVVLAARAKGHEIVEEAPGDRASPEFRAMNPLGKIPVLVIDEPGEAPFVLPESGVIVDYLDATLTGPALLPADPREAARAHLLSRMVDAYIIPHAAGIFNAGTIPEGAPAAVEAIGRGLAAIQHFRRDTDRWLVGDAMTVADCALMPFAFYFEALGPLTAGLMPANPALAAWWEHAKASELGQPFVREQADALRAFMRQAA